MDLGFRRELGVRRTNLKSRKPKKNETTDDTQKLQPVQQRSIRLLM